MSFLPREKQIRIGDVLYKIRELKASQRSILLFRTNEILGGSIESFVSGYMANAEQFAAIGGVLTGLTKTTSPEVFNKFIKDIILTCVISPQSASDDTDIGYEMHFCEYYDHMPELLWGIYDQNFGSTIQAIKKKLSDLELATLKRLEKTEVKEEEKITTSQKGMIETTQKPLVSTNFLNGR